MRPENWCWLLEYFKVYLGSNSAWKRLDQWKSIRDKTGMATGFMAPPSSQIDDTVCGHPIVTPICYQKVESTQLYRTSFNAVTLRSLFTGTKRPKLVPV